MKDSGGKEGMKHSVIGPVAASALAVALLTGCGGMTDQGPTNTAAPGGSTEGAPQLGDALPDALEPEREDGTVHDTDGLITDSDSAYGKNGDGTAESTANSGGNPVGEIVNDMADAVEDVTGADRNRESSRGAVPGGNSAPGRGGANRSR